ncbi:hypothetical protein H8D57_01570 [bacterium]|nr:hypothetical protein [bacterium]
MKESIHLKIIISSEKTQDIGSSSFQQPYKTTGYSGIKAVKFANQTPTVQLRTLKTSMDSFRSSEDKQLNPKIYALKSNGAEKNNSFKLQVKKNRMNYPQLTTTSRSDGFKNTIQLKLESEPSLKDSEVWKKELDAGQLD